MTWKLSKLLLESGKMFDLHHNIQPCKMIMSYSDCDMSAFTAFTGIRFQGHISIAHTTPEQQLEREFSSNFAHVIFT